MGYIANNLESLPSAPQFNDPLSNTLVMAAVQRVVLAYRGGNGLEYANRYHEGKRVNLVMRAAYDLVTVMEDLRAGGSEGRIAGEPEADGPRMVPVPS